MTFLFKIAIITATLINSHVMGRTLFTLKFSNTNNAVIAPLMHQQPSNITFDQIHDDIDLEEENDIYNRIALFDNIISKRRLTRRTEGKRDKMRLQNENRMRTIIESMEKNYYLTEFLHQQVLRIKHTKIVYDDLRRMVNYLERRGSEKIKRRVLGVIEMRTGTIRGIHGHKT